MPVVRCADSSGLLHPVQGDVQQHGADYPALGISLLGAGQSTVLDHTRLQPLLDHSPGGERAELGKKVVVGDPVERPGQVSVEHPPPLRVLALGGEVGDGFDRVMAAAAGSKSVGPRLEPRLPLGLQRVDDPCLMAPVENHGNSERTPLALLPGFGMSRV